MQASVDGLRLIVGPWARLIGLAFDFVAFVLDSSGPHVWLAGTFLPWLVALGHCGYSEKRVFGHCWPIIREPEYWQ